MNWTGGPNAWACWSGPDVMVGEVVQIRGRGQYWARDATGSGLGLYGHLQAAKDAVERAASRA